MKDLALYFAIIAVGGVIFLPLHIVAVRARGGSKLIATLNSVIGLSAVVAAMVGWLVFGDMFSSHDARALACVAGGLSFIAYAGLYSLLGPSSVDRSVSVHIVKLLWLAPGQRMTETELFGVYTHADMLEKRFHDCINTGIIQRDGEQLVLTRKGMRIARLYMVIGESLGMRLWYLDRFKKGTKPSFPNS